MTAGAEASGRTGEQGEQSLAVRAEHFVTALLAVAGTLVLFGSQNIRVPLTANVVDPRFVPRVVGVLLLACAALHGVTVARGNLGSPDEGEDVDLSKPADWKAFSAVGAAFIVHSQLISRIGWPLAAVVLFGGSALGLGAKRPVRVLAISVAVATVAFVVFRILLGVYLPAGPFERWM